MTTQVQIRGTTQATQEARTLVSRELDINTTDWRLSIHNGSTAGGIKHVNCFDQQNSEFNYAVASGTNALTASMRIVPTGYIAGAIYIIKISNNNTGSVTLNLNSLGAKTLKKYSGGVLSNLESGDLISGMMIQVLYDGTYFQVVSGIGSGGTERISWIPTNVTSYIASNCIYVDLGYAVIVSYDVVTDYNSNFSYRISNLPFTAETKTFFPVPLDGSGTGIYNILDSYISQGGNTLWFTLSQSTGSTDVALSGTVTYIKD